MNVNFSKKAKPARIHDAKPRFAFGKALVMVSLLVSCADEVRRPPPPEPERVQIQKVEPVGDCIERYFESDFSVDPSFGRMSRNKMDREMRKSVERMFSRMGNENSEYYAEFFAKARYSNGDLMFPNAADVISGNVFPDENSKRLAGRRMAKSMRPRRFPNAYSLLHSMPKTAVALVDRVNKSGSGMDVEHAEDIAGFFRMLIGFQNRMGSGQKACDFVPNMSREQLNELDSYYSDKIINWNNPVTGKRVCTNCKKSIESGEFQKFGIVEFPRGLDVGFCE
jgi:hypothetical protein